MRKTRFRMCLVLLAIAAFVTPALADRTKGVVKSFNANEGMGILTADRGGDVYVSVGAISGSCNGTLHEGQAVEFEIVVVVDANKVEKRTAREVTCR